MSQQAIDKIRAEMTSNANNVYVQVIGNFLLLHLEEHPEDAQYLALPGKTIVNSLNEVKKVASKRRTGDYAVLSDSEGFAIALNYFRSLKAEDPADAPKQTEPAEDVSNVDKPKRERKPKPKPQPAAEPVDETDGDPDAELDTEDEEEIDLDELLM